MELKRVVVTGLGALTPVGHSVPEFWKNLVNGVSGAAPITRFDASNFKTQFACEVKNFDPFDHLDRKEARKMDPFVQFAMVTATQAVEDAKLDPEKLDLDRIGVVWGSGIGGMTTVLEQISEFALGDGTPRFNPFFIPKMIIDIASGYISIKYGFRGPNYSTVSACASSTHAVIDSYNLIRLGKADAIVTGGSEATVIPSGVGGFNAMHALSTRNDSPQTASRPFDKTRDGFVMGEGSGALILEEYEHAKKRGANIYAEIVGGGMSADAYHITAPHPQGLGAKNVMHRALDDAGMQPSDIDYINVHGTSTPLGDISEITAIIDTFGKAVYDLNISSTKSMTGHLLGAAGAIESIACILAIRDVIIPPTINFSVPDTEIDQNLNLTLNKMQRREIRTALNNTFGFGGHNASLIIKKLED